MAENTTRRRRTATTTTAVVEPPEAAEPTPNESETAPTETDNENDESESGSNVPATTGKTGASKALSIPGISATFEPRAMILPEKLSVKSYVKVVEAIDGVREGSRWWFGDALVYAENKSETYSQVLDASKYDYATLKNFRMVAKRYPPDTRTFDRSWSHYHACIGLPLDEALKVLAVAERDDWSVAQVRLHVKEIKDGVPPTPVAPRNGTASATTGTTAPVELPGIQPIDVDNFEGTVYDCPACNLTFDQPVWHCIGCGGHYAPDVEECPNPNCGADVEPEPAPQPAATTRPSPAPTAVAGVVINAGGSQIDLSIIGTLVGIGQDILKLDASAATEYILSTDGADPEAALGSIMALANWLNQVAEDLGGQISDTETVSEAESVDSEADTDEDGSEDADDDINQDSGDDEPESQEAPEPTPAPVRAEGQAAPKPGATRRRKTS